MPEKKEEITDFEIQQIQDKVRQIQNIIKDRDKKISDIEKAKEQLDNDQEKLHDQTSKNVKRELNKVVGEHVFVKSVRAKLDNLKRTLDRSEKTQTDIIDLYRKGFRRVVNERVTIGSVVFDHLGGYYSQTSYLTLYSKGFGYCYGDASPSKYIGNNSVRKDWVALKKIFSSYGVVNHITKPEKIEMFNAFSDAISNWVDLPFSEEKTNKYPHDDDYWKTIATIRSKTTIPLYEVKTDFEEKIEDITQEKIKNIKLQLSDDGDFRFLFETTTGSEEDRDIDDLDFGSIFALSIVWRKVEEIIDNFVRKFESITENNELVLSQLKRKVAHFIVVEEL